MLSSAARQSVMNTEGQRQLDLIVRILRGFRAGEILADRILDLIARKNSKQSAPRGG